MTYAYTQTIIRSGHADGDTGPNSQWDAQSTTQPQSQGTHTVMDTRQLQEAYLTVQKKSLVDLEFFGYMHKGL